MTAILPVSITSFHVDLCDSFRLLEDVAGDSSMQLMGRRDWNGICCLFVFSRVGGRVDGLLFIG